MEKDPVCGTYVDVASAPKLSRAGEFNYFCSVECLEKFKKGA
jgi:YHS domain-containing protein